MMLNSKIITFASVLVVLICVILSITAAPIDYSPDFNKRTTKNQSENATLLQSDAIPVSSSGDTGKIVAYDNNDVADIPKEIVQNGSPGGLGDSN